MAKYKNIKNINKEQEQKYILELCHALGEIKGSKEAALLLSDLLGREEILMIAKRLQIAKLLIANKTYQSIQNELDVSSPTISRVNAWLTEGGEGFRTVVSRLSNRKNDLEPNDLRIRIEPDQSEWARLRRRYPLDFLFLNILKDTKYLKNQRERKRMREIIQSFEKSNKKKKLFREIHYAL